MDVSDRLHWQKQDNGLFVSAIHGKLCYVTIIFLRMLTVDGLELVTQWILSYRVVDILHKAGMKLLDVIMSSLLCT